MLLLVSRPAQLCCRLHGWLVGEAQKWLRSLLRFFPDLSDDKIMYSCSSSGFLIRSVVGLKQIWRLKRSDSARFWWRLGDRLRFQLQGFCFFLSDSSALGLDVQGSSRRSLSSLQKIHRARCQRLSRVDCFLARKLTTAAIRAEMRRFTPEVD